MCSSEVPVSLLAASRRLLFLSQAHPHSVSREPLHVQSNEDVLRHSYAFHLSDFHLYPHLWKIVCTFNGLMCYVKPAQLIALHIHRFLPHSEGIGLCRDKIPFRPCSRPVHHSSSGERMTQSCARPELTEECTERGNTLGTKQEGGGNAWLKQ